MWTWDQGLLLIFYYPMGKRLRWRWRWKIVVGGGGGGSDEDDNNENENHAPNNDDYSNKNNGMVFGMERFLRFLRY